MTTERKQPFRLALASAATLAIVMAVHCGPPDPTEKFEYLNLEVAPDHVISGGKGATVTVSGADNTGAPLAGKATISAACGTLNGNDATKGVDVALSNGHGTADFGCDLLAQSCCKDTISISAVFGDMAASAIVRVGGVLYEPDAGNVVTSPDAGTVVVDPFANSYCASHPGNMVYFVGDPTTNWHGTSQQTTGTVGASGGGVGGTLYQASVGDGDLSIDFDSTKLKRPLTAGDYQHADDDVGHAKVEMFIRIGGGAVLDCVGLKSWFNISRINATCDASSTTCAVHSIAASFAVFCSGGPAALRGCASFTE